MFPLLAGLGESLTELALDWLLMLDSTREHLRLELIQDCNENEHNLGKADLVCFGPSSGIAIAIINVRKDYSYALTKNLTHEPAVTGVQSSPGQHSIIPPSVFDGDTCNCDVIQHCRFQFSWPVWVRGAHRPSIGRQRIARAVCVRVRGRQYCPNGYRRFR